MSEKNGELANCNAYLIRLVREWYGAGDGRWASTKGRYGMIWYKCMYITLPGMYSAQQRQHGKNKGVLRATRPDDGKNRTKGAPRLTATSWP